MLLLQSGSWLMLGELEQAEELLLAARARQAQRALTKDIHDGLISGRLLHRKGQLLEAIETWDEAREWGRAINFP